MPALFGVAAAFAVAQAPSAQAAHVPTAAAPAVAQQLVATSARPLSVTRPVEFAKEAFARQATAKQQHSAAPATYTVKSGDTLTSIAEHFYHSPDFWPVIYWANHSRIPYANEIEQGQVLTIPVKPDHVPATPTSLAPAPVHQAAPAAASNVEETSVPVYTATQAYVPARPTQAASSSYTGGGGFQSCVISSESGGNSQIMNGSGHYGLYQFSASTWAAYGGNPADFGNASVAQQNQVFDTAIADGGASNWSAYDGC